MQWTQVGTTAAGAAAAAVLVALAGCSGQPGGSPSTTSTVATTTAATTTTTATAPASTPVGTTSARPSVAPGTIPGAGLFEVGVDVQPGTYVSENPPGSSCYVARLGKRDAPDSLITNYLAKGRMTVTVLPTDAFVETRDCATWTKR